MEPKPKLAAFDLDGTLTVSKSPMTPAMGAVFGRLLAHMPAAVMSGAALHQFEKQFLPYLPADANLKNLYLFPTNAAQCYTNLGSWEPTYAEELSEEEKSKILNALETARRETGFEDPPQTWGPQVEDRSAQITFSALGQEAPPEVKRVWDPTLEKRLPLYRALCAALPEFSVGLNAATSIDITKAGITKAYGIRRLSEISGIPIQEMLYVGDALGEGGNDAVVKETGVPTREVSGPEETAALIESLLSPSPELSA